MNINLDLVKQNKTFCMYPWIHLHTTPSGVAAPCCISQSCTTMTGMGNSNSQSLEQLVNSDQMKKLRLDMITGVKNDECTTCYKLEDQNVFSPREQINSEYWNDSESLIQNTNSDGSLTDFKMKYFDIRFNNICNFKCRTCGQEFSSQWEQENLKHKVSYATVIPKNNNPKFLQEVVDQIQYMTTAYFAGGEPLITEEHYILLEEMIKQGRTDIVLRYNTNLSNLKFKDKDLLGLWKHFNNRIDIFASIDHYGARAEYIRHGTNWAIVEENFLKAKQTEYLNVQINTVLSIFNVLTINDFYKYLIDKQLYSRKDHVYSLYPMTGPEHLTCLFLPLEYKTKGKDSLKKCVELIKTNNFSDKHSTPFEEAISWLFSRDTWESQKHKFQSEIERVDNIRGEDFSKTFPELAGLLYE